MKQFKMFLILIVLFLFTGGAFGLDINIPSSIIQIEPPVTVGDFTWVNPGYIQTISTCLPEKISIDEETYAYSPFVYEDYAAWRKGDYIYLWQKGSSAVRTTIPAKSDIYDLNDNKILYEFGGRVYLYDIISETSSQLSISTKNIYYPSYDNNELAYIDNSKTYFLSGNTIKQINSFNNNKINSAPSLHNGKIAWAELADNGHYQIFYWNGSTITQITMTNYNNFGPNLYNGKITWSGYKNGHYQIFYWNGNTITQITNTNYDNSFPKLYNGKIIWHGNKDGHYQIFYWNGNEIKQLTNNNYNSVSPDIYNGKIVWLATDSSGDYRDIYTCTAERPSMNTPTGQNMYTYSSVENPVLNVNPAFSKPFAVGNIPGGTLNLKVGLNAFINPVDIYLAISYSGLPGDIFLIDSNGLHKNTIVPWKTNQTDAVNESLFGDINTANLPVGNYTLYILIVPAGATNMDNSYLWVTGFNITH